MLVGLVPVHCAAALGVPEEEIEYSTIDLLLDPPRERMTPARVAAQTWEVVQGLRLLPSTVSLARAEAPGGGLIEAGDRDRRLRRGLEAFGDALDYCIVDCPPTIGLLTFNALRAADEVVVPVETGFLAARGAAAWSTLRSMAGRLGRSRGSDGPEPASSRAGPRSRTSRRSSGSIRPRRLAGSHPRPRRDPRGDRLRSRGRTRPGLEREGLPRLAEWIETGDAVAVDPPAESLAGSTPARIEDRPAGPAPTPMGPVRTVEVSARAADLVRRMGPRTTDLPAGVPQDRRARISVPAALGHAVRIIGDLNHWQPEGVPLAPLQGLSPDFIGIDLPIHGPLRYRLLVDGRQMLDPINRP